MLLVLGSCNVSQYLAADEVLYDKVSIKLDAEEEIEGKNELQSNLYGLARPKPNTKFLGLARIRLFYHYWGNPDKKGFKSWVAKRAEEPALLDTFYLDSNCERMETFLFNEGYFHSECNYETNIDKFGHFAHVTYSLNLDIRQKIDNIAYLENPQTEIDSLVKVSIGKSVLKKGVPFDTDLLQTERKRLSDYFRNQGYFDFGKDYITFQIDSTKGNNQLDISVLVGMPEDSTLHKKYVINEIYLDAAYNLKDDFIKTKIDTQTIEGITIYDNNRYKADVLTRRILFRKGDQYSLKRHRQTFDNLQSLGVFRFVNLRFEAKKNKAGQNVMDVYIRLTPSKRRQYSLEGEINNRFTRNTFNEGLGVALSANYLDKNAFGGGERFSINMFSGLDLNIIKADSISVINAVNISGEAALTIPKMLLPFPSKWLKEENYEKLLGSKIKTRLSLSDDFVRLVNSHSVNGLEMGIRYDWQPAQRHRFLFTPISLGYFYVYNTEPNFDKLIANNVRLQKAYSNRLIIGGVYSYLSTNQKPQQRNFYTLRGDVEFAGNTLSVLEDVMRATKLINNDFAETFGGLDFSQFIRLQADFRYYIPMGKTTFVSRFYGGLGVPYGKGDENVLPYIRQFFSGGSNGVRAFRLRGLGPGSWSPPSDSELENIDFERTGDVKLEVNLEYRFPIYKWFKGAAFVDAGNVWTLNDTAKIGSEFQFDSFGNELGLGVGAGMRMDFTYFIMRIDMATPMFDPQNLIGNRWVVDEWQFFDTNWLKDNVMIQLGIGYPF